MSKNTIFSAFIRKFSSVLLASSLALGANSVFSQTNIGDSNATCSGYTSLAQDRYANRIEQSCGVYRLDRTDMAFVELSNASVTLEFFTSTTDDANPPSLFNQIPDTSNLIASEAIPGSLSGSLVVHEFATDVVLDFNAEDVYWQTARATSSDTFTGCYGNTSNPDALWVGFWTSYGSTSWTLQATNVSPALSGITMGAGNTSIDFTADIAGTAYWLAVPQGATAPTADEIKAGANYGAVTVADSGSAAISVGANTVSLNLSTDGDYTVYLAGESSDPYLGCPAQVNFSLVSKSPQTITFNNPGTQTLGASPTLSATADSGLAVTFSSATTGVCTVTAGGDLMLVTEGDCTINADQAGDATYLAATQVQQTFAVLADTDGDGAPDANDAFPSDPVEDTDTDGDGIGDNGDAGGTGVGIRLVGAPVACSFDGSVTAAAVTAPNAPGTPFDTQLEYALTSCGESVTVQAVFGDALPYGAVAYKVSGSGEWTEILGATIAGDTVTYTIEDNGPLDADPTAGRILDPLTVVTPAPRALQVPVLPIWMLALLGLISGGVGIISMRRS